MTIAPEYKDPDSIIVRGIDWTKSLQTSETISTSIWLADPGITIDADLGINGLVTKVKLSGGTIGTTYKVTNRITTSGGETLDLSLTFIIAAL